MAVDSAKQHPDCNNSPQARAPEIELQIKENLIVEYYSR